jgi:hypothetical protein
VDEFDLSSEVDELRQALARQQRATRRAQSKTDDLVEAVYRAARDAAMAVSPTKLPAKATRDPRRKGAEVALVHATDWQLGKHTPGYSIDLCRERIMRFADKVLHLTDIQRADHPVKDCHVMFGGDMVEGVTVFPGQAFEVEAHLFEQLFTCAQLMQDFVDVMLTGFESVSVTCEYGNHGRLGRRGEVPGSDNVDRFAYQIAANRYINDPRVEWTTSSDWFQIVTVGNYRALLVHGDEIKSFGGNTPAFGILRKCNQWGSGVVPSFDDVYMGHFHTPMTLTMANGGQIYVTGSPESENAYAAEFVAATGNPSQRLHFVNPEAGRVTAGYLVWLD